MAELNSIPRLPVFGWSAFSGARQASAPSLLDRPGVLFTTSGRAAIALALERLGVVAGDSVLVPTYHCTTMVSPIAALGAKPIFFPIGECGGPDIEAIRSLDTTRVRAIIAVHYFGIPQSLAALRKWCDDTGILLIEDCAHALFGTSDGRDVGQWGDAVIGSLTKFLPVPEGGCLLFNRPVSGSISLRRRGMMSELRAGLDILEMGARHDRMPGLNGILRSIFAAKRKLRGGGSRPPDRAADDRFRLRDGLVFDRTGAASDRLAMACHWIARTIPMERVAARRRNNYARVVAALSGVRGVRPLFPELPPSSVPYVVPLWVNDPDLVYHAMRASGLPVFRWDWLWPGVPHIVHDHGMEWSTHVLQLGCHQDLDPQDIDQIVDLVREVVGRAKT
jgi:dTDP-4-amino-4,6-dideoxygalactose transaminase